MGSINFPEIIKALRRNNYIFKFGNQFFESDESDVSFETSPTLFTVSDYTYEQFKEYIENECEKLKQDTHYEIINPILREFKQTLLDVSTRINYFNE